MRYFAVFILLVVAVSTAICDTQVSKTAVQTPAQLQTIFDGMIRERQELDFPGRSPMPVAYNNAYGYRRGDELIAKQKWTLAKLVMAWEGDKKLCSQYRAAVMGMLKSPNPSYRALACEMLGAVFNVDNVEPLATLLEDKAESIPTPADRQSDKEWIEFWQERPVGRVAGLTLHFGYACSINSYSPTKSDFDAWWKDNKGRKDTAWYWNAKWGHSARDYVKWVLDGSGGQVNTPEFWSPRIADFSSSVPKEKKLKLMLSLNLTCVSLNEKAFAQFVKDNKLKPQMIELMAQKNLAPEFASSDAYRNLVRNLLWQYPSVFDAEDEPALAAIQKIDKPYRPCVDELAMLRIKMAPERAKTILVDSIKQSPGSSLAACELIRRFGCADKDALMAAVMAADSNERQSIASAIETAAEKGLPIDKDFLAFAVRTMRSSEYSVSGIHYLAKAANIILAKDIVSDKEIEAARGVVFKGTMSKEERDALLSTRQALADKVLAAIKAD